MGLKILGGVGINFFLENIVLYILKGISPFKMHKIEPRSDRRDLLAIKVKSEIFTEKVRPSCCEQLQKI